MPHFGFTWLNSRLFRERERERKEERKIEKIEKKGNKQQTGPFVSCIGTLYLFNIEDEKISKTRCLSMLFRGFPFDPEKR